MGHDSAQAALIYQHKSQQADPAIAEALDAMARIRKPADPDDSGTGVAREA
ncbi:MAG: hypothetical protein ACRDT8_13570 [Micromonosporaceae bacterium]